MNIDLSFLDKHDIICWDIDGTLINNFYSPFFYEYIREHPEKKHHFITFRDSVWGQKVYEELAGFVDRESIAGLHTCPQILWEAHESPLACDTDPKYVAYTEWKGKTAADIGGTVMIDDMPYLVLPGCYRYNVSFVDARRPCEYEWERRL